MNNMSRICDDKLWLDYKMCFELVKYRNPIQDRLYGGRLRKGLTYIIGKSPDGKKKFYMTMYDADGSVELWSRTDTKRGAVEETHSLLAEHEFFCAMEMLNAKAVEND